MEILFHVFGDLLYGGVGYPFEFLIRFFIRHANPLSRHHVVNYPVKPLEEPICAFDSPVAPFCVLFRRPYKESIKPDGIGPVFIYKYVRAYDIAF